MGGCGTLFGTIKQPELILRAFQARFRSEMKSGAEGIDSSTIWTWAGGNCNYREGSSMVAVSDPVCEKAIGRVSNVIRHIVISNKSDRESILKLCVSPASFVGGS